MKWNALRREVEWRNEGVRVYEEREGVRRRKEGKVE